MTFHISKDGVFTAEAVDLNSGRHHLWQVSILEDETGHAQLALAYSCSRYSDKILCLLMEPCRSQTER